MPTLNCFKHNSIKRIICSLPHQHWIFVPCQIWMQNLVQLNHKGNIEIHESCFCKFLDTDIAEFASSLHCVIFPYGITRNLFFASRFRCLHFLSIYVHNFTSSDIKMHFFCKPWAWSSMGNISHQGFQEMLIPSSTKSGKVMISVIFNTNRHFRICAFAWYAKDLCAHGLHLCIITQT